MRHNTWRLYLHLERKFDPIEPKKLSWNVARMTRVLKIKGILNNFGFIRSHSTGEVKIF